MQHNILQKVVTHSKHLSCIMCQHQNEIYLCHCLSQDRLVYETGIESLRIMLLFDSLLRITNDNPIVQSYSINPKVKVKYAPHHSLLHECVVVCRPSSWTTFRNCGTYILYEVVIIEFQDSSAAISHYRN